MSIAIVATGTLLQYTISSSATTIPEVKKISGPDTKFDLLDATSHDSGGYREFVPGLHDGDMITAELNWKPTNTVHIKLRADNLTSVIGTATVVFPDTKASPGTGATVSSSVYVSSIVPKADVGVLLEASLKLKITGAPTWT